MVKSLIGSALNAQVGTSISDRRKVNIDVEFDRRQRTERRQVNASVKNDRRKPSFGEDSTDRRKVDMPVENNRRQNADSKDHKKENLFVDAFEALPPFRRVKTLPDQIQNGNGATALGMASLALINLPEDLRDIRGAIKQFRGKEPSYDYTKCQHPFSFFRGTFLKHFANPETSSNPKLAKKILKSDKTLAETSFGKKILKFLGVEKIDRIETKIQTINSTKECPKLVSANIYKGTAFGKLTARCLERSTVWGLGAMTLLELPQIINAFCHDSGIDKKAENGGKQVVKSAINIAAITAGIGYMGALGARYGGPAGSLIGMGAGAVLGGYGSKQLQSFAS